MLSAMLQKWAGLAGAAAVLAAVAFGIGYRTGDESRNDAWLLKEAQAKEAAQNRYVAEVERGNDAAADLISQLDTMKANYAQLEDLQATLLKTQPLAVYRPRVAAAPRPSGQAVGPRTEEAPGSVALPAPVPHDGTDGNADPVGVDVGLSLTAVWLWNHALTGIAAPAGACRIDAATGQADAACATQSGLSLPDAWSNHTVNARACAEDRLRHQRLIDFLQDRDKSEPAR